MLQERSNKAQMILNVVRKKRSELVKGMERLCDAYITLAYMDASRHKTEKSERPPVVPAGSGSHLTRKARKKSIKAVENVEFAGLLCGAELLASLLNSRGDSHPCRPAHHADQRSGRGCHPHPGAEGADQKIGFPRFYQLFPSGTDELNNHT